MSPLIVLLSCFSLASAFVVPNAVFHQYRSQDELGGYTFGYSGGPSSRAESRDHFGTVLGAFNHVNSNGEIQKYEYIADALGHRLISGTHLPVAVEETAEVAALRATLEAKFRAAATKPNV